MESLLEVSNLSHFIRGAQILNSISFDVREGEILGLIGPNGSGKTSLIETLVGLRPADAGSVFYKGELLDVEDRKKRMFYLPDGVRPYGGQYVHELMYHYGAVFGRMKAEILGVAEAVGLLSEMNKTVASLSKGFNNRLLLGIAFLSEQTILLLDEPFDGFDLRQTLEMTACLKKMKSAGTTFILASHRLADVEKICDRFLLIQGGRALALGGMKDLNDSSGLTGAGLEQVFLKLTEGAYV